MQPLSPQALASQWPSHHEGGALQDAGGEVEAPLSIVIANAPVPKGDALPTNASGTHWRSSAKRTARGVVEEVGA